MNIRTGGLADVPGMLELADAAMVWLAQRGLDGQWGTTPFSERPATVAHFEEYAGKHLLRVAEDGDGRAVGFCVLAEEVPGYLTPAGERELYVRLLLTDRSRKGSGIGAALIADAREEAARRGIGLLRVDCYAGDPQGRLVAQYRRLGFTPSETFQIPRPDQEPWPGQVLELRLSR
jgi:GNAT superfamily N-acetyltransferase